MNFLMKIGRKNVYIHYLKVGNKFTNFDYLSILFIYNIVLSTI